MLTVGHLARILNVTAKTLRHYDSVGLFAPEKIGADNQYRLYSPEQLPVLRRILFLRSMGLGIEVIRELQRNGTMNDAEKVKLILLEHAHNLRQNIAQQQKLLDSVTHMVEQMTYTGGITMEPRMIKKAAFTVTGMIWNNKSSEEGGIPYLWQRFIPREDEIKSKVQHEISYGVCIPGEQDEFSYIAGYETQNEHTPDGMINFSVPEQSYAVFTHKGSVDRIGETMELIYTKYMPLHGLLPLQGIDLEVYDERFMGPDHVDSEVDIYIPIKN